MVNGKWYDGVAGAASWPGTEEESKRKAWMLLWLSSYGLALRAQQGGNPNCMYKIPFSVSTAQNNEKKKQLTELEL